jgi:hypothetical protein
LKLVGLEKLDELNGLSFRTLPPIVQKRFLNSPIRSFVLEEGTDESARIELFRRVNTSSKQLSDAEIRKGAFRGAFLDLVLDCANRPTFKRLAPGKGSRSNPNPDSERQELVTRFFVYSDHYLEFRHDVRKYLDINFKLYNQLLASNPSVRDRMSDEFDRVMSFIDHQMPGAFFRTSKTQQVPRVRFEAISVGVCLALRVRPNLQILDLSWMNDPVFLEMIRTDASNSGPRLQGRVEYVRDALLAQ